MLRRGPRVAYRDLEGDRGAVLLHLDTGAYHGIDRMGALIWDLLDGAPSFGQLLPRLSEMLDGTPSSFEAEIAEFLLNLRDRKLIEVVDPSAP